MIFLFQRKIFGIIPIGRFDFLWRSFKRIIAVMAAGIPLPGYAVLGAKKFVAEERVPPMHAVGAGTRQIFIE